MARGARLVEGRWRIVETEMWDREALDLVAPAHISVGRNGLGEMQLIAIGASIDYRVEERGGGSVVEFSWSGFDDMDPTSGRGRARVEGDTMRGRLFIHQGDDSSFVAKRGGGGRRVSGSNTYEAPGCQGQNPPVTKKSSSQKRRRTGEEFCSALVSEDQVAGRRAPCTKHLSRFNRHRPP